MVNPHGDLDKDEQLRKLTSELYGPKVARKHKVRVVFSERTPNILFATCNYLQYVFVRNFDTQEIVQRINLASFPTALSHDTITNNLFVGLDDGWFLTLSEDGVEQTKQRNYLDGPVISLQSYKSSKILLAIESKGIVIYRYQPNWGNFRIDLFLIIINNNSNEWIVIFV